MCDSGLEISDLVSELGVRTSVSYHHPGAENSVLRAGESKGVHVAQKVYFLRGQYPVDHGLPLSLS
jgi:hypothetical protein